MQQILNRSGRKRIAPALWYILMVALAVVLIFPYFYMLMKSLMTPEELSAGIKIFPDKPQFRNYVTLFTQANTGNNYFKATLNSLIIIGANMIIVPLSASIIAFSFAKLRWFGRNFMFAVMLGTMMLPGIVTQVPLYVVYSKIGWLNTFYPFIIPNLFGGGATHIFLIRQFMLGIPKEMDEAARLDGANAWKRYWSIVLPLCRSVLVYIMVTIFMSMWSDYYGPLMYMTSSKAPRTLAYVVFLSSMEENVGADTAHLRMAAGVFMTIIPLILFAVFQRELVEGINISGVKG